MNTTKKAPRADGATPKRAGRCYTSALIIQGFDRAVKESIPIYVNGRVVGYVKNGVFYKTLRASVHFLRRPPAIAFDVSTLFDAQDAGATRVEVTDMETGRVYVADIGEILRDGRYFDRGHGRQVYLLLSRWRHPDAPEQLSLFGDDPPPNEKVGEARLGRQTLPGLPRGESLLSREKEVAP